MSVPLHSQVRPGTVVSIVLKQDQRTGRQVQGSVAQVLTRGNHPRGVKVRLSDGRVGRVQQLVNQSNTPVKSAATTTNTVLARRMADHNPWATEDSQRNTNQGQQQQQYSQQQPYRSPGYPQQQHHGEQQQSQQYQQQYQQPAYNQNSASNYYAPPSQQPDYNAWSDTPTGNPPLPQRHPAHTTTSAQGVHRSDTDELLASQSDRAEQMEHMQAFEATASESEDDKNRAQLEKEFPDIDGSLIAAIYGDTKDLSETREMLQELGRQ